ncbi:ribosomal-protein-alanine N-acetyltransferase [Metabacillus crassostreae]|uniref:GNAT family N-acetyltransferase n=1 Tax=Metabacillus crassostreae TaxID=929098 RepID=UPI00195A4ADA|nr:GNAT family protein [Metabacillus crassostreae]MBM7602534.1 ribosomal-protein-alanine N-acetyltransferase [Metabacillus crassostreae]
MFPRLKTERLILREISKSDAKAIYACFSNEHVTRFYGQETFNHVDEAIKLVDHFTKNYQEKRGIRWGIEIQGNEEIIGTIGFNAWSPKHKRAEVGYEIHPNYWRKGYTLEAVLKVIQYGFNELELTRIGAVVFKENEASNKLLLKAGFQNEGILRNYMYQNGIAHDTLVYSILNSNQ